MTLVTDLKLNGDSIIAVTNLYSSLKYELEASTNYIVKLAKLEDITPTYTFRANLVLAKNTLSISSMWKIFQDFFKKLSNIPN